MQTSFVVDKWREYRKGDSLRGYVAVRLPSGMIIREITVHQRGSSRWASPPAKPITQDGQPCLDPRGKQIWMEYISFVDKHTRDRFSISVCNAVAETYPDVFDKVEEPAE